MKLRSDKVPILPSKVRAKQHLICFVLSPTEQKKKMQFSNFFPSYKWIWNVQRPLYLLLMQEWKICIWLVYLVHLCWISWIRVEKFIHIIIVFIAATSLSKIIAIWDFIYIFPIIWLILCCLTMKKLLLWTLFKCELYARSFHFK
jgi:hypothetical protein